MASFFELQGITRVRSALEAWESIVGGADIEPLPIVNNPLWRVTTATDRAYVLKQLPEFAPGAGPVDQFRALGHLQAAGVPVAPPIVTDDARINTTVDDTGYALLPYLPSDPGNHELGPDAAETSYAIGAAIGHIDMALAECPWSLRSYVDEPDRLLGETLPELPAEATRPVAPLVDRLRAATSDLPTQRTVGDCNTGNVLVHGTRVSGFIDLDHLPIGPRIWDLSDYLASRLNAHLESDMAERDTAAMLAVLGSYVTGYHETNPLSERELAAIVPLVLLITIGGTSWHLHGWVPKPERYRHGVRVIAWITEHLDELTTAAGTPPMP